MVTKTKIGVVRAAVSKLAFQRLACLSLLPLTLSAGPRHIVAFDSKADRESTYTISAAVKLLPPYDIKAMNDPYQDVELIGKEGELATVRITYYPLNDDVRRRREARFATVPGDLKRYLAPSTTCNWDGHMKREVESELKAHGIDRTTLSAAEFVGQVAHWALNRSRFVSSDPAMPADWFVRFDGGKATVPADVQSAFNEGRPQGASDQQVFAQQLWGKTMFEGKTHGACTSSAIYLATILRSLGIPTRILYFVPLCDGNDEAQLKLVETGITNHRLGQRVLDGLASAQGFANHMFNEVWIDGRWRRLNYDKLDQDIVDPYYLGMMTHIDTCADISETNLQGTWGLRSVQWPNVAHRLASVNPYSLVSITDHWGKNARLDNPPAEVLKQGTVTQVVTPGSGEFRSVARAFGEIKDTDALLFTKEWIPGRTYIQLREFEAIADPEFALRSPGKPQVRLRLNGKKFSGSEMRCWGVKVVGEARPEPGVEYTLVPRNQGRGGTWVVPTGTKAIWSSRT